MSINVAIIFLHEIYSTDTSKPQNFLFLGRRVSLFRGLYFTLKFLCNCSCKCNFCWTFVITLNAENIVPQENVTLIKSSAKFCGYYVIFSSCDFLFFIFERVWSYGTCSWNFFQRELQLKALKTNKQNLLCWEWMRDLKQTWKFSF